MLNRNDFELERRDDRVPDVQIDIRNVSFQYEYTNVLQDISLQVHQGDFLALLGPNGSGKSTLLKLILGLLKPMGGSVQLFGQSSEKFKQREWIGYVSQKSNAFNSGFPATVREIVKSGLAKQVGLFKRLPKNANQLAEEALTLVGMEQFIDRNIGALSGGQQQRVFIARALISKPKLLILDEPTVGIDHENVQAFYDLLVQLNEQQGITMVLVTHDVNTVSNRISHVACLNQKIHFHGYRREFDVLPEETLNAWYGHAVRKVH